jgi:hypothetical protein
MEAGGHCFSLQFADLVTIVHLHQGDFKKLEDALNALMEDCWARMEAHWCDIFEILRGRCLFGGKRQWWIDEEEIPLISQEYQWVN